MFSAALSTNRLRVPTAWIFGVGLLAGLFPTSLVAEQFLLQVPGRTDLTSRAEVTQRSLTITDSQNQTFTYQRVPQFDSRDGNYLGFYSRQAGQSLRWPANNRGSMLIGSANGGNWRQSQQQIRAMARPNPIVPGPQTITTRRPVMTPGIGRPGQPQIDPRQFQQNRTPFMQVAYAPAGNNALDVGYINPQGGLQFFRGFRDQWQPQQLPNALPANANLLPGAPLQLVSRRKSNVPNAYTVNRAGQLIEIANGSQIRPVANQIPFTPGSHFTVGQSANPNGFAVDQQGRLWNLDLVGGQHRLIDQQGRFSAGAPISWVNQPTGQENLFLVDQQGQLLNYAGFNGNWNGPQRVATGFPAGAPISSVVHQVGGQPQLWLGGVDTRGRVQALAQSHVGWQPIQVPGTTLTPGTPLAFTQANSQLALSGIGPGGVWNQWSYQGGRWNPGVINRGFYAGAPVIADPISQTAFGVDATGRLVTGGYWEQDWHSHLLVPHLDFAPTLVRRQVIANRPLNPATVVFDNSSQDELVLQMIEQFSPRAPQQLNIPPGGSVPRQIPRDGGGTLQEVYLVPGPFGELVERVETYPLPPQPGPTIVVWAKRVTYSYIDRKGISVVPDFDMKSQLSVGVFDLPPGEFLRDGERFDAYREAAFRQNAGAAQFFGPPIPDGDVGVRLYRDYGQAPNPAPPLPSRKRMPSPRVETPLPSIPNPTRQPNNGPVLPPLPQQ